MLDFIQWDCRAFAEVCALLTVILEKKMVKIKTAEIKKNVVTLIQQHESSYKKAVNHTLSIVQLNDVFLSKPHIPCFKKQDESTLYK